jgi:hypothetical protein
MEILSLSLLIVAITIYDEIINGQGKVSSRLLERFQSHNSVGNSVDE